MPLPEGSGIAVSVNFFGPHLVTPRGNTYILLFTHRFSAGHGQHSHQPLYSPLGMTAQHTLGQRPPVLLKAFACRLQAVWVPKIATSSYHPNGNDGEECVNHTMAKLLTIVVNDLQNCWDEQLPHVELRTACLLYTSPSPRD